MRGLLEVQQPWTKPEDFAHLQSAYESLKHPLPLKAEPFIANMEWRIYTEWCLGEGAKSRHSNYQGEGFTNWITNETHFTLEHTGAKCIDGQFTMPWGITYSEVREKLLVAAVNRSVDFFSRCEDYKWVKEGNAENLRTSLQDYL